MPRSKESKKEKVKSKKSKDKRPGSFLILPFYFLLGYGGLDA
jgi:hypothetical protein